MLPFCTGSHRHHCAELLSQVLYTDKTSIKSVLHKLRLPCWTYMFVNDRVCLLAQHRGYNPAVNFESDCYRGSWGSSSRVLTGKNIFLFILPYLKVRYISLQINLKIRHLYLFFLHLEKVIHAASVSG